MKRGRFVLVLILYLLGLFMGALDTGIVTPARTVIQMDLGVEPSAGIWMITIYTLFYAASIPIMGKLADLYGRKPIYLLAIFLFGLGSLFCGLSNSFDSFTMLIIARAVQALGGGGIMPVATAEFGTSFPPEKRGMALGMVGGVYGIANVFGASVGSLIMDVFGTENWSYIFYLNVPITIFILIAGLVTLSNTREESENSRLDIGGILILTIMILSLLYGLRNLDFFEFGTSITSTKVYPYLIVFAVLLPLFLLIENRVKDPVMNLKYFTDRNILMALIVSVISGVILMGIIFVPQLGENVLKLESGDGGYLVIVLGLFAGVGAPVSGKLIDKFSAKAVLTGGFIISGIGALFIVFVTCQHPGLFTVMVGLVLLGLGLGFTMGTPLNYMMLANTEEEQANSAMATMSLVRSLGTAIAPAIMVGFISHAGLAVQDNLMDTLPDTIKMSNLPYYQEIKDQVEEYKNDPDIAEQMGDMDFEMPDIGRVKFSDMQSDDSADMDLPDDILDKLQNSDVTTITSNVKILVNYLFDEFVPDVLAEIDDGISQGIDGVQEGREGILDGVAEMKEGYDGIGKGISGMKQGVSGMKGAIKQLKDSKDMVKAYEGDTLPNNMSVADLMPSAVKNQMPESALTMLESVKSRSQLSALIQQLKAMPEPIEEVIAQMETTYNMLEKLADGKMPSGMSLYDLMPASAKSKLPSSTKKEIKKIHSVSDIDKTISRMNSSIAKLEKSIKEAEASQNEIAEAMDEMRSKEGELADLQSKMIVLRKAVPGAFDEARENYLLEIDERQGIIEEMFQNTLNVGFKNIYKAVVICSAIGIMLLLVYSTGIEQERNRRKEEQ